MTRDPKERDGISQYRTFLKWRPCCCCGLEFRRENGWAFQDFPFFAQWAIPRYLCESCGPDRMTASRVFDLKPWLPPMPKVAPPTPPKAR